MFLNISKNLYIFSLSWSHFLKRRFIQINFSPQKDIVLIAVSSSFIAHITLKSAFFQICIAFSMQNSSRKIFAFIFNREHSSYLYVEKAKDSEDPSAANDSSVKTEQANKEGDSGEVKFTQITYIFSFSVFFRFLLCWLYSLFFWCNYTPTLWIDSIDAVKLKTFLLCFRLNNMFLRPYGWKSNSNPSLSQP